LDGLLYHHFNYAKNTAEWLSTTNIEREVDGHRLKTEEAVKSAVLDQDDSIQKGSTQNLLLLIILSECKGM
jgi:hypothetical protein